jgi:hypothetical protein
MTAHPKDGALVSPVQPAPPSERPAWRLEGNPVPPQLHEGSSMGGGTGPKTPGSGDEREPSPLPGQLSPGLMKIALAMSEEQLLSKVTLGTRREPGMCKMLGLGWIHHRRSEMTNPGWPDLVIKAPIGRVGVMFRELKRQKEKPTAAQREWLDALSAAGLDADWWRPSDYLSGRVARELAALAGMGAR